MIEEWHMTHECKWKMKIWKWMKVKIKMHVRGGMHRGMHSGKQGENSGKQGKTGENRRKGSTKWLLNGTWVDSGGKSGAPSPADSQRIPRGSPGGPPLKSDQWFSKESKISSFPFFFLFFLPPPSRGWRSKMKWNEMNKEFRWNLSKSK